MADLLARASPRHTLARPRRQAHALAARQLGGVALREHLLLALRERDVAVTLLGELERDDAIEDLPTVGRRGRLAAARGEEQEGAGKAHQWSRHIGDIVRTDMYGENDHKVEYALATIDIEARAAAPQRGSVGSGMAASAASRAKRGFNRAARPCCLNFR